jgi:mannitol/fructose-specific phosphotransferase system IIA component (Ntr-type)
VFRAFPDLRSYLDPSRVRTLLGAPSKREALLGVAGSFAGHPAIGDHRGWLKALYDREDVTSTGIGGGIAIPHAQHPSIRDFVVAIARCPAGIEFNAKDAQPVRVLVMLAAPPDDRPTYLKVLAGIAARLNRPTVVAAMLAAPEPQDVIETFLAG